VVYLLVGKRGTGPEHAQRFLILGVALNAVEVLAAWATTHHFDPGSLGGLTGTLIWLGYLNWSRRVANTYGQPEAPTESPHEPPTGVAYSQRAVLHVPPTGAEKTNATAINASLGK
jgi:hypothetical protein